jgi:hypothetical protein
MNVNRVTLSAFGTTGVLLAASLTMLAMVSALVTFDAWPSRDGGASADDIAIERAPAAHQVRAVRGARDGSATASRRGRATADRLTAASRGGGDRGPSGPGNTGGGGSPRVPSGPTPYVPPTPPGEGDPGPGNPVGPKDTDPTPDPSPIRAITCGAGSAVAGVNGGAGAAVGTACKTVPPPSSNDGQSFEPMAAVAALTGNGD